MLINGKPAKEYAHKGKVYLEGRKDTRFSIRIRNNSYSRKLFVPTVDGLSVMDGKEGSFDSSGYIVQGNSSVTIDGWRTSDKEVAEFYFSSPDKSYRAKMGRGNNLGVIGVAVFNEYFQPITVINSYNSGNQSFPLGTPQWNGNYPFYTTTTTGGNTFTVCDSFSASNSTSDTVSVNFNAQTKGSNMSTRGLDSSQAMCCSANLGSAPTQALGTGWGEQKNSEVTSVAFERVKAPETIFELHYNTRENLEKIGISFQKTPIYVAPSAFPGQYCKPPVHNVEKNDSCYSCTKCGASSGDGDGLVGAPCNG